MRQRDSNMVLLGIIFSLTPIVLALLLALPVFYLLANIDPNLALISIYLPYIPYFVFYTKRLKSYQDIPRIKMILDKFLIFILLTCFFLNMIGYFLLPFLEIICLFKIHKLEQYDEWEEDVYDDGNYFGSFSEGEPNSNNRSTTVSNDDIWHQKESDDSYKKYLTNQKISGIILFVTYFPSIVALLVFVNLEQIPSGIIMFFPYLICIPIYITYLYKRINFYSNSPEIRAILDICFKLAMGSLILLFPFIPILLPIIETVAYFKVKRMVEAGYYEE